MKVFESMTANKPEKVSADEWQDSQEKSLICEQERLYSIIFEKAEIGIFKATLSGENLIVNPKMAQLLGYESPENFTTTIQNIGQELYVEPRRYAEFIQLLKLEQKIEKFEAQVFRRDGRKIWVCETAHAVCDRAGNVTGYIGTLEDITERKQAEANLSTFLAKEKEISRLQSRFLSMVCHEFRSLLTVILATSDLLKLYGVKMSDSEKIQRFDKIGTTVKNMAQLLEGILAIGKAEAGKSKFKRAKINVESFISDIYQDVQTITKSRQNIILNNPNQTITLLTDKSLFRQIFMNLLLNAAKYSPSDSSIYVDTVCKETQIIFRIRDEGIGIPPEDRDRLFELFHRANNVFDVAGTGLGLAMVKRAVELHGGSIALESEVGVGTTFTVTLPTVNLAHDILHEDHISKWSQIVAKFSPASVR